ncbi:MAG: alkaline phosphatase [Verrucomicrobiota bacterium]
MNWRIKILTVALLALFALGCFFYVRFYVSPKAHGIVLFIAPAADLTQLANLEDSVIQNRTTTSTIVTDHFSDPKQYFACLSTAVHGMGNQMEQGSNKAAPDNLFYKAQRSARRIGIISSTSFTHPAAAAFYSHSPAGTDSSAIAPQLFDSTTINVMLGGNPKDLIRDPQRNLINEAKERGYEVIQSPDAITGIPRWRTRLLLGVFDYPDDLFDPESHATSPSLEEMTILAIECLQFHIGGYFMVVVHPDPSEIEYAGELPDEFKRAHAYQLNAALRSACDYTGENGMVLLYAPQPDSNGWLLQLKGNSQPEGILSLKEIHTYIQQAF